LEKISVPQSLRNKMEFHSSYCELHTYFRGKEELVNPIQKMVVNGNIVCPRCEVEKETRKLEEAEKERYRQLLQREKYNLLYNQSVFLDETIKEATLDNYKAAIPEERNNKQTIMECLKRLKEGEVFNIIFQGNPGAGKSHLAYGLLRELNESGKTTSLFVSIESMIRLIKETFNNKSSKYTEQYFIDLLSSVDYLALDDLGAETGAINTDKSATDFVQRVLYAVATSRQNKPTFITMNLTGQTLFKMYDSKLVSRLLKKPKYILFKETQDKRITEVPF